MNGESHTTVLYYEYNENGKPAATRCVNPDGTEYLQELYEYEPDGSCHMTAWAEYAHSDGTASREIWYDSHGEIARAVIRRNGETVMETVYDRTYDGNGKIMRELYTQSGVPYESVYLRDGEGRILLITTTSSSSGWKIINQTGYDRNESGRTVYQFTRDVTVDPGGNTSWTVDDTEYDLDSDGARTLCSSRYRKSHYGDSDFSGRELQHRTFELYQGDQGSILGVSPFPPRGTAFTSAMSLQDFEYLRHMTRWDALNSFEGRQVSGGIIDAGITSELYGYQGALRFVFSGKDSDRMESVWWVCDDPSLDEDLLLNMLEWDGFEIGSGTSRIPNPLGGWEYEGKSAENEKIVISSVPEENLTYFCLSFEWEEEEPDAVRRWEQFLAVYE